MQSAKATKGKRSRTEEALSGSDTAPPAAKKAREGLSVAQELAREVCRQSMRSAVASQQYLVFSWKYNTAGTVPAQLAVGPCAVAGKKGWVLFREDAPKELGVFDTNLDTIISVLFKMVFEYTPAADYNESPSVCYWVGSWNRIWAISTQIQVSTREEHREALKILLNPPMLLDMQGFLSGDPAREARPVTNPKFFGLRRGHIEDQIPPAP